MKTNFPHLSFLWVVRPTLAMQSPYFPVKLHWCSWDLALLVVRRRLGAVVAHLGCFAELARKALTRWLQCGLCYLPKPQPNPTINNQTTHVIAYTFCTFGFLVIPKFVFRGQGMTGRPLGYHMQCSITDGLRLVVSLCRPPRPYVFSTTVDGNKTKRNQDFRPWGLFCADLEVIEFMGNYL